mgnify:FL=1
MAWTVTNNYTVFGNKGVDIIKISADAATQTVQTKLSYIEGFSIGPISMASAAPIIKPNSAASGTQVGGVLGCAAFTSGDECYITVFGH